MQNTVRPAQLLSQWPSILELLFRGSEPQRAHRFAKEREMSETLWCVHIGEQNDFIATLSKGAADEESAAINA